MAMTSDEMAGAEISERGLYRHQLWRRWGRGPQVLWIMLNPSTADGKEDDATIRRCIGFTRAWGCDGFTVVNLYALRATDPRELRGNKTPNTESSLVLYGALGGEWKHIVAAWGTAAPISRHLLAIKEVGVSMMSDRKLECLGITQAGHPRHPLYVPRSQPLEPWPRSRIHEFSHQDTELPGICPIDVYPSRSASVRPGDE